MNDPAFRQGRSCMGMNMGAPENSAGLSDNRNVAHRGLIKPRLAQGERQAADFNAFLYSGNGELVNGVFFYPHFVFYIIVGFTV